MDWNLSLSRPQPDQSRTLTHLGPGPDGPHGPVSDPARWARGHGPHAPHTRTLTLTCALTRLGSQTPRPVLTARSQHTRMGRGCTPHTWTPQGHRAEQPSEGPHPPHDHTHALHSAMRIGSNAPSLASAQLELSLADHDQRTRSMARQASSLCAQPRLQTHCPHMHSQQHGQYRPYHGSRRTAHTALGTGPDSEYAFVRSAHSPGPRLALA